MIIAFTMKGSPLPPIFTSTAFKIPRIDVAVSPQQPLNMRTSYKSTKKFVVLGNEEYHCRVSGIAGAGVAARLHKDPEICPELW